MIFSSMITDRTNQFSKALAIFVSVIVILALSVSMAGAFCENDCDDDCKEESSTCCACICCPSNVVMSLADNHSIHIEYLTCLWTLSRTGLPGEQEWFTDIDRPPQIIS